MLSAYGAAGTSWDCDRTTSVGIMNSDGLVGISEIAHNTLGENVEGSTQENFIGW